MNRLAGMVLLSLAAFLIVSSGTAVSQTSYPNETSAEAQKTVVDMTAEELLRFYSKELSHVEFNVNQDEELAYLLRKAGDKVESFFLDFSNTSSKEHVLMQRTALRPGGSSEHTIYRDFNYLILPSSGMRGISLMEDRADSKNRPVNQKAIKGFMISSGYAGLCLYLHPSHQANSRFRYLGRETRKPRAHVIAFAQKPEARDYLAEYVDMSLPTSTRFLVQGFVWLEPESCQIMRMRTNMLLPENPTILREQSTDISYERVQFEGSLQEFWLPREVNVRWEFPQWIYSNRHKYSDYHLFSVKSDYQIAKPEVSK